MNETVKIWFEELYKKEIEEVKEAIKNESIWERGYDGEESNPHTENIEALKEYLSNLEGLLEVMRKHQIDLSSISNRIRKQTVL